MQILRFAVLAAALVAPPATALQIAEEGFPVADPPWGSGTTEWQIAADGDWLVRGDASFGPSGGGPSKGHFKIYELTAGGMVEHLEVVGAEWEKLGFDVAIEGDVIAVAAGETALGIDPAGAVYVYRYDGSTWSLDQTIFSPDPGAFQYFGKSVALSGELMIVGEHQGNSSKGAAYVYRYNSTSGDYEYEATFTGISPAFLDEFGSDVDIDDGASREAAIVGAPESDLLAPDSGIAVIYVNTGSGWAANAWWGYSSGGETGHRVAIEGDVALSTHLAYVGMLEMHWDGAAYGIAADYTIDSVPVPQNNIRDVKLENGIAIAALPVYASFNDGNSAAGALARIDATGSMLGEARFFHPVHHQGTISTGPFSVDIGDYFGQSLAANGDYAYAGAANDGVFGTLYRYDVSVEAWDWSDLGNALAGTNGEPGLRGVGSVRAGETARMIVDNAVPFAPTFFAMGFGTWNAPFYGGVLVPDITTGTVVADLFTNGEGRMTIDLSSWPGLPPGAALHMQPWIIDGGAPQLLAATNAVRAVTAP